MKGRKKQVMLKVRENVPSEVEGLKGKTGRGEGKGNKRWI